MEFMRPATWRDALHLRAEHPAATALSGGTDVMVEINLDHRRPDALLDLSALPELREWSEGGPQPDPGGLPGGDPQPDRRSDGGPQPETGRRPGARPRPEVGGQPEVRGRSQAAGWLRIGAGVPYTRLIDELGARLPGLAMAARTVGSPQIRNRGTLGGNLGSGSPAGDGHPPLLASGALVEVESVRGVRNIPIAEFFTGVKRTALAGDELIAAVHLPQAGGPQQFAKVGTRNAMVIAVCTFALALHPESRRVGTGVGSAGPTPFRALEAEDFLAGELDWDAPGELPERLTRRFGELVAAAARPIDDVRGTADYRKHALGVLAHRALRRVWHEHRTGRPACA